MALPPLPLRLQIAKRQLVGPAGGPLVAVDRRYPAARVHLLSHGHLGEHGAMGGQGWRE